MSTTNETPQGTAGRCWGLHEGGQWSEDDRGMSKRDKRVLSVMCVYGFSCTQSRQERRPYSSNPRGTLGPQRPKTCINIPGSLHTRRGWTWHQVHRSAYLDSIWQVCIRHGVYTVGWDRANLASPSPATADSDCRLTRRCLKIFVPSPARQDFETRGLLEPREFGMRWVGVCRREGVRTCTNQSDRAPWLA